MFICAAHKALDLTAFNRLYAYPVEPVISSDRLIILDSGAFALSQSKKQMDADYMYRLAAHYERFKQHRNVHCIAPDVFKNPAKSLQQFRYFRETYSDVPVCPVLQSRSKQIDLFCMKKQIDEYFRLSSSNPRFICLSNHKFEPLKQHRELSYLLEQIRLKFKQAWVHVLGAGYSHNNVKDWLAVGVDSVDSISYYTDAQQNLRWLEHSYGHEASGLPFAELALENARVANT